MNNTEFKRRRQEAKLSKEELAELMGRSYSSVDKWESGRRPITDTTKKLFNDAVSGNAPKPPVKDFYELNIPNYADETFTTQILNKKPKKVKLKEVRSIGTKNMYEGLDKPHQNQRKSMQRIKKIKGKQGLGGYDFTARPDYVNQ